MKPAKMISLAIACVLAGCSVSGKLESIRRNSPGVTLGLPYDDRPAFKPMAPSVSDTIVAEDLPNDEVIIMKAVKDEDGEMVATDVISAAMVTARFRNVAERHGKVDLRFRITVPAEMRDTKWQLRFFPDLYVLGDTLALDPVIITGVDYRRAQLRGYQQYEKFLNSIITNDSLLIRIGQLEIFLKRNLPQVYAFKTDSTFVSDEQFYSHFGVTELDALDHYTDRFRLWRNDRKKSMLGKKYQKYIKVPIVRDGLRLDTVMRSSSGDFIYDYIQTLSVQPTLRKAEIALSGTIFEQDRLIYQVPPVPPLTYYISSLSTLADASDHYVTNIIERSIEANTACYIAFAVGHSVVDRSLGDNAEEIGRIEENLASLARNKDFDLDSIVVTASASPEGSYASNAQLTSRRSASVASFFRTYLRSVYDTLYPVRHYLLGADGGDNPVLAPTAPEIQFISRNNPENWQMLDALVKNDDQLSESDKRQYFELSSIPDPDLREHRMLSHPSYLYIRQTLYPRLRTVKFDFYLHRRGMEKDTVHTTALDTVYMRGLQAIHDRDYKTAVSILRPYHDYNTAVAYCSLDYNASALEILQGLDATPQVNYLLAVIHSRMGHGREAFDFYQRSCEADPSFVHRGNLDPEISALVQAYSLQSIQ